MTGFSVLITTAVFECLQNVWINVMETMCTVYVQKLSLLNVFPYLTVICVFLFFFGFFFCFFKELTH